VYDLFLKSLALIYLILFLITDTQIQKFQHEIDKINKEADENIKKIKMEAEEKIDKALYFERIRQILRYKIKNFLNKIS
jgi:hypothetical protein